MTLNLIRLYFSEESSILATKKKKCLLPYIRSMFPIFAPYYISEPSARQNPAKAAARMTSHSIQVINRWWMGQARVGLPATMEFPSDLIERFHRGKEEEADPALHCDPAGAACTVGMRNGNSPSSHAAIHEWHHKQQLHPPNSYVVAWTRNVKQQQQLQFSPILFTLPYLSIAPC